MAAIDNFGTAEYQEIQLQIAIDGQLKSIRMGMETAFAQGEFEYPVQDQTRPFHEKRTIAIHPENVKKLEESGLNLIKVKLNGLTTFFISLLYPPSLYAYVNGVVLDTKTVIPIIVSDLDVRAMEGSSKKRRNE